MADSWGACLIAYGEKAKTAAARCLASIEEVCQLPVTVCVAWAPGDNDVQRSRWAKVTLPQWSPYDYTVYLDADTVVRGSLTPGFQLLDDGWDLVITPSHAQGEQSLWHLLREEKEQTWLSWGTSEVLQLQAGVFWFRRTPAVLRLFERWQQEWLRWRGYDQGALLRALRDNPVRVYLLSRAFNGGAVVAHYFGAAA